MQVLRLEATGKEPKNVDNWRWLTDNWLALVVLGGLVGAWFFLRTSPTRLASVEEFHQRVRSGRPAVVEFFSNT